MSLDITLVMSEHETCPHCSKDIDIEENEVFSINITHNLNKMAFAVGIYEFVWRPEEMGITKAQELTTHLSRGLRLLKETPDYYRKFNPSNGWGSYEALVSLVENYLEACQKYPEAIIKVYR